MSREGWGSGSPPANLPRGFRTDPQKGKSPSPALISNPGIHPPPTQPQPLPTPAPDFMTGLQEQLVAAGVPEGHLLRESFL